MTRPIRTCLLCKCRQADKTGSHIIPSFFMKRINGEGRRDHEVGFEIKDGVVDAYFGRDVYEEQRRTITDQEDKIGSRENNDVRDYIFCSDCEKYFGSLENAYSKSLSLNQNEQDNTIINNRVSSLDAMLFWCSLVWRSSVTAHFGQRLSPSLEERLRLALLNKSVEGLATEYSLGKCEDYQIRSGNGTAVCLDIRDNIALLIVDEYMLVMVFDNCASQHKELLKYTTFASDIHNDGKKPERIYVLSIDDFSGVMESVFRTAVESMGLLELFASLHNQLFGYSIPDDVLKDVLYLLHSHDCKLGDRYTIKHYAWCYKEVLMAKGLIKDNGDGLFSVVT